ncbi:Protein of unknown function [Leuconostoc citreum LBAE E16]|nr:Protein of unknown function [Leuconostoc citreum LBAE C10]CCF25850.1 Protein of unknown function [Leuconostoc citreum LBAE C11]CCF28684.1 Protein of unknown function [Leuconostoc citreum LBAE E16]
MTNTFNKQVNNALLLNLLLI